MRSTVLLIPIYALSSLARHFKFKNQIDACTHNNENCILDMLETFLDLTFEMFEMKIWGFDVWILRLK